jgi:hypothetical protein
MIGTITLNNGKQYSYNNPVGQHYHLSGENLQQHFDKRTEFLKVLKGIVVENCEHDFGIWVKCQKCGLRRPEKV